MCRIILVPNEVKTCQDFTLEWNKNNDISPVLSSELASRSELRTNNANVTNMLDIFDITFITYDICAWIFVTSPFAVFFSCVVYKVVH